MADEIVFGESDDTHRIRLTLPDVPVDFDGSWLPGERLSYVPPQRVLRRIEFDRHGKPVWAFIGQHEVPLGWESSPGWRALLDVPYQEEADVPVVVGG